MATYRRKDKLSNPWMAAAAAGCMAAIVTTSPRQGAAQEKFPARPIEMIVPTPPGGGVDITGRMLAEAVEPILGVKVVIVNVAGASGGLGVTRLAAAKPDGYTLAYVWNAPLTIAPHVLEVAYTLQSYTPVSQTTGGTPLIFCVRPDFPAASGKELVEVIKRNPDKYTYGTDGVGAMVQLAGERLFQPLGLKLRAVPFGGAADTLRNFLGEQIDIYGGSVPAIGPHMKDGKAKCLLATTATRNPSVPDATSAGELDLADKASELWRGVIAPSNMPRDRFAILEEAFRKAAHGDGLKAYAAKTGERMVGGTSEEFGKVIASEHADFGQVVRGLGLAKK
jgi:tripartite-type tricarboxylate transporter receptor subunit TctC